MASSRVILNNKFKEFLGTGNVYFQPPESVKLKFPCIVYSLANIDTEKADNRTYNKANKYTVTLVHANPDNTLKEDILDKFEHISMNRIYVSDQLYHYVYTLYFNKEE